MMPWSQLRTLIDRGREVPVTATLTLHGEFDGSQYGWVIGGERIATVVLDPGEYRLTRDESRLFVAQNGVPRVADDGENAVVMTDGEPLDAASSPVVVSAAGWFFSPGCLDRALDEVFPSGPVIETVHEGRRAFRIPGLPAQYMDASGAPRSITVDAETGVLLAVDTGDGGGELTDLEFPDSLTAETFRWDAARYGAPRRPEPVVPESGPEQVDEWDEEPAEDAVEEAAEGAEPYLVPPPEDVPAGHRVIQAVVRPEDRPHDPNLSWEQGVTTELDLGFVEDGDAGSPERWTLPDVIAPSTVTAWSEPVYKGESVDRMRDGSVLRWESVLRGDGWTAFWDSDRPTSGYVNLTGSFVAHSYGAPWRSPTRAFVHRIEECSPAQRVLTLDLDAAAPPVVAEEGDPPEPLNGVVITRSDEVSTLWRRSSGLPVVWGTDLTSGKTRRVLLPLPVAQGFSMAGGEVLHVDTGAQEFTVDASGTVTEVDRVEPVRPRLPGGQRYWPHPDGGWIVFSQEWRDDEAWPVNLRLGRLSEDGDVRWVLDPADPVDDLWVFDGQIVTGWSKTLTLRDADLEVVRRVQLPLKFHRSEQTGPWLGQWVHGFVNSRGVQEGEDTYQLIDPLTGEDVLSVPVPRGGVSVQWLDGELWVADDRLRLFTQDAAGKWTGREVEV